MKTAVKWILAGVFALALTSAASAAQTAPAQTRAAQTRAAQAPSLQEALKGAAVYKFGQSREPLTKAEEILRAEAKAPEGRARAAQELAAMLKADATRECKDFVCRQLALYGTDAEVPALAALLADKNLADMARYALEKIPGPTSLKAMRDALGAAKGKEKIGIVNSLGVRRDAEAVAPLAALLADSDAALAGAAARSLGRIANPEAAKALLEAVTAPAGKAHSQICAASLLCAEQILKNGKTAEAEALYQAVEKSAKSPAAKAAAFKGAVLCKGEAGLPLAIAALRSGEQSKADAAIGAIRAMPGAKSAAALAEALPSLPPDRQICALTALNEGAGPGVEAAVQAAAKSPDAQVRMAALQALGRVGGAPSLAFLAEAGAAAAGAEREAARRSLASLRGKDIDAQIAALLPKTDPAVRVELIHALGARTAASQIPALVAAAETGQGPVQLEALKALGAIESETALLDLLILVGKAPKPEIRTAASEAAAAVCRRLRASGAAERLVVAALRAAKDPQSKAAYVSLLREACGPESLKAAQAALKDPDPAVQDAAARSLSEWPLPEAMPALLQIAKGDSDPTRQVLALRGYIRLIPVSVREDDARLPLYKEAMGLAKGDEEKRLVLSGVGAVRSLEAMQFSMGFVDNEGLREEAAAAAAKTACYINDIHPKEVKAAMSKVLAVAKGENALKAAKMAISEFGAKMTAERRSSRSQAEVPVKRR